MADQLQIIIGADIKPLDTALTAAGKKVEDFSKTTTGAADAAIDTADAFNIAGRSAENFSKKAEKVPAASGQASIALTNLSRVVSDAPFGFIAIANNIDPLVQSFGSLQTASGKTGGVVKALTTALRGPAGILVGFSLVSTAITVLIQKYGSLGGAIDALFGKTTQLTKEQKEFAKGLGNEAGEVANLVGIYQGLQGRRGEQEAILKRLNTIAPQYFNGLNAEKTTIEGLTVAYDKYLNSLVGKIFIESQNKRLQEIAAKYSESLTQLLDNETKVRAAQIKRSNDTKTLIARQQELANINQGIRRSGDIGIGVTLDVTQAPKTFAELIQQQLELFKRQAATISDQTKGLLDQLDFRGAFAPPPDPGNKVATRLKTELEIAIDLEEQLWRLSDARRKLSGISPEVALQLPKGKIADLVAKNEESTRNAERQAQRLRTAFGFDITKPVFDLSKAIIPVNKAYEQLQQAQQKAIVQSQQLIQNVSAGFNTILAPAIDSVFNAIANGENIFKSLGDSLKRLVIQLAATVVKAAALAAILTIVSGGTANPLTFGQAFQGVLSGGGGGLPPIGQIGRVGGAAAPQFPGGAAFTGGGLQLAGQVTFVQRGPDLVGVLNAGNARINRVG